MKTRTLAFVLVLAALMMGSSGCTYMQNRGDDFSELIDAGVTVSSEPQFSLYAGFLNLVAIGYSDFDGQLYGLANGQCGTHLATHDTMGLVLYGREEMAYAPVPAEEKPTAEPWKVGFGLLEGPPPPPNQVANCPKLLHLGWGGLALNCKFGELADFLVGWTTLDIMGDDM
jgi:hypothetical protein